MNNVTILVFQPCDLHSGNSVEIWRNDKFSGSSTSFPVSHPWWKVIREARELAQEYSDPESGTPAPVYLARLTVYRSGDEFKARVERLEEIPEYIKVYQLLKCSGMYCWTTCLEIHYTMLDRYREDDRHKWVLSREEAEKLSYTPYE